MNLRTAALCASLLLLVSSAWALELDNSVNADDPTSVAKAAHQLYSQGKFEAAAEKYESVLKLNNNFEAAQVGLAQTLRAEGKIDEALKMATAALAVHPESPTILHTLGDIYFRRGEMGEAETAYLKALRIDSKDLGSYVGLAQLYGASSFHRQAYAAIKRAHELDPTDPEVQMLWLETLPKAQRLSALKSYTAGPHPDTPGRRAAIEQYSRYLEKTGDQIHNCSPVNPVDRADLKLTYVDSEGPVLHILGVGLQVKLNGHSHQLLLDSGAGGILISRKAAERAKLRYISDIEFGGIGDKDEQPGYLALADQITIGGMEFHDCVVEVGDKRISPEIEGLIGSDVFASYLVDIDMPQKVIRLSPLPQRPGEDKPAPILHTSSEADKTFGYEVVNSATELPKIPKERYIATEMENWTRFFRFEHMVLVPTRVNDSPPRLFLVDTGAFANTVSTRTAKSYSKMEIDTDLRVKGVSGNVENVYRAEKVSLAFGRFHQPNQNAVTLDLSQMSQSVGTELAGLLGYDLLSILEIKIDYRDGLIDFVYKDRHGVAH